MSHLPTVSGILSFATVPLAVIGLVRAVTRREISLAGFAASALLLAGLGVFETAAHRLSIVALQRDIASRLAGHRWTFEQIVESLPVDHPPPTAVYEAIERARTDGWLREQRLQLRDVDAWFVVTRIYFLADEG